MADLSKLSDKERSFLCSIPYRVGVWISNVDDNVKSNIDDREERKALEALITNMAAKSNKIPFAGDIMKGLDNSKGAWPTWDKISGEEAVLADVDKALKLCEARECTADEIAHYKKVIWQIGIVVAQAYGEHIDPDNEMHVNNFFRWVGSLSGGAKLGGNPENMSPKEKAALNKLRSILKE